MSSSQPLQEGHENGHRSRVAPESHSGRVARENVKSEACAMREESLANAAKKKTLGLAGAYHAPLSIRSPANTILRFLGRKGGREEEEVVLRN